MPLPLLLLLGDLLALLAFVLVGQRDHNVTLTLAHTALLWAVFVTPWVLVGAWLGAFPTAATFAPRVFLQRSLNVWLIAGPLGILFRSISLSQTAVPVGFWVAGLSFGGLFVLGWRALFALFHHLRRPPPA